MKIAVFCSANKNIDPDFFTLTEEMGKWMAENGHDLVFGGCNSGLMDCIGKAVKANGGRTIGVVPTLVERGGRTFPDLDIEIPCDNLSDRKDLMLAQGDIFVALPGGIESLAINDATGEVFIGTNKGLCSYMSDATATNEEMTQDNVWAYPNPVKPDYTGLITITGLSLDADVKIVSTSGTLVNQGRSNGGTYTWNGCDQKGRRVASGIYMVETATSNGEKGTVCKIAIIR